MPFPIISTVNITCFHCLLNQNVFLLQNSTFTFFLFCSTLDILAVNMNKWKFQLGCLRGICNQKRFTLFTTEENYRSSTLILKLCCSLNKYLYIFRNCRENQDFGQIRSNWKIAGEVAGFGKLLSSQIFFIISIDFFRTTKKTELYSKGKERRFFTLSHKLKWNHLDFRYNLDDPISILVVKL